jgi:hypothetical protein
MSESTPAGWYPAAHANNEPRYWDGTAWQDQAAAPPGAPSVASATLDGTPAGGGSPAPQGFAVAALIVGIAAFLTGLVPWFGLLLAIAAVLLAIFALRRRQRRGFAITGLILGGIALLTGLIVAIVFSVAASNPSAKSSSDELAGAPSSSATAKPVETTPASPETQSTSPAPESTQTVPPSQTPSTAAKPAAPAADLGKVGNPYPQPYVAKGFLGGEKYSLTGSIVDADASARVAEWNQFNDEAPAGFKYVVVQLTMTGIDEDGVEPSLAAFDLSLATAEGNRYDNEFVVLGDGMSSMSDGPTLYPGSSFTGFTVYVVPDAAQTFLLYDNGNFVAL